MAAEEGRTNWGTLLAKLGRDRVEERHGVGVLVQTHGRPEVARGCLLPDGTSTEARCVAVPDRLPSEAQGHAQPQHARAAVGAAPEVVDPAACVWARPLPGGDRLTRRGWVLVEPGMALRFVDEPLAGEGEGWRAVSDEPSLERDLAASPEIARRVRSDVFAQLLYAALCNTEWRHGATGAAWSSSWRLAGDVVAHLRGGGDYLEWHCSGGEGLVDEGVLATIEGLGWELAREAGEGAG